MDPSEGAAGDGDPCGPPPPAASFASLAEAEKSAKDHALANGYSLVLRDKYPRQGDALRYTYRCGKGRLVASQASAAVHESKRRKTSSQMTACLFSMSIKRQFDERWAILPAKAVQGSGHNHPAVAPTSFGYIRSQTLEPRRADIVTMWNSGIRPRDIVTSLANPQAGQGPPIKGISRKDVINLLAKHRLAELAGRTPLQWLLDVPLLPPLFPAAADPFSQQLDDPDAYYFRVFRDDEDRLQRLFIAPRETLECIHQAPDVLQLDCTYKTNRFNMPLLSICGVSPLRKSFQIAAVFLEGEAEEQYAWALETLHVYYHEKRCPQPTVIITDRDLGLINALKASPTYREIPHLLCRWHVNMNVLAKTKKYFPKPTRLEIGGIQRHQDFQDFLKA